MNFLLSSPLQESTSVDHACSLINGDSPLLLVSCHDSVHGYMLQDDSNSDDTSSMHRVWSCSMLDRMEGLLQLPMSMSTGKLVTGQTSSMSNDSGNLPRVLMLTSDADLELYSVQTGRSTGVSDLPSPPHMERISSCALEVPTPLAGTSAAAVETAGALPDDAADALRSASTSGSQSMPSGTASRRPEGPTWSGALRVVQREGSDLGTPPDAEVAITIAVVSVYHDFLHLVRVKECLGVGMSRGPDLTAVAVHLGSSVLSGVDSVGR